MTVAEKAAAAGLLIVLAVALYTVPTTVAIIAAMIVLFTALALLPFAVLRGVLALHTAYHTIAGWRERSNRFGLPRPWGRDTGSRE